MDRTKADRIAHRYAFKCLKMAEDSGAVAAATQDRRDVRTPAQALMIVAAFGRLKMEHLNSSEEPADLGQITKPENNPPATGRSENVES